MDILLDSNGDIDLSTGDLQIVTGSAATAQRVKRNLQTFLGEIFTDTRVGFPWFRDVFRKPARLDLVKTRIRQMILLDEGVDSVDNIVLSFTGSTRTLSVTVSFTGTDGEPTTFSIEPILP